ncbi:MAG: cytidylyltransferase domain-containing protein [Chloroflexota bacterium]
MAQAKNIVTIVEARVASNGLPGKVMKPVLGRPLLERVLQRVCRARLVGTVVVATTVYAEDDVIAQLCWKLGVSCYRGDAADVLDRHYRAAVKYGAEVVVKIGADCPLIDPDVIDAVIGSYVARPDAYDYVSNLHPPSFPEGNGVEVIRMSALEKAWREAWRRHEREKTTPYFWNNSHQFRLHNVVWEKVANATPAPRWRVEGPEELQLVQAVYGALYRHNPHFGLEDVLALLEREPQIAALGASGAGLNGHEPGGTPSGLPAPAFQGDVSNA